MDVKVKLMVYIGFAKKVCFIFWIIMVFFIFRGSWDFKKTESLYFNGVVDIFNDSRFLYPFRQLC
jgi:hypothetical protein